MGEPQRGEKNKRMCVTYGSRYSDTIAVYAAGTVTP